MSRSENKALLKDDKSSGEKTKPLGQKKKKAFWMVNHLIHEENQSLRQQNQVLCKFNSAISESQKSPWEEMNALNTEK